MNIVDSNALKNAIEYNITILNKKKELNSDTFPIFLVEKIIDTLKIVDSFVHDSNVIGSIMPDLESIFTYIKNEKYLLATYDITELLNKILSILSKGKDDVYVQEHEKIKNLIGEFEPFIGGVLSSYENDIAIIRNDIRKLRIDNIKIKEIVEPFKDSSDELQYRLDKLTTSEQYVKYIVDTAQQIVKDSQEIITEVRGLANIASQSGLAKEFEKCIKQLQPGRVFWLIMVIISILGMGWILTWDLLHMPSPSLGYDIVKNWAEGVLHRLPIVLPCVFAIWLSSRRYHDTVRLIEDYRFKSRLCATYSGFLDACRRIDGCTEMAATGEGGQPVVQTRRSYDAEMELTRTVLRVISTDPTRHLRKDKQDSGPILGLAEHCVDAIAGVVKRDRKGD